MITLLKKGIYSRNINDLGHNSPLKPDHFAASLQSKKLPVHDILFMKEHLGEEAVVDLRP